MSGLGLLSPWFLLGALAVTVPIVLHLLRRRTDPVLPFSAVRLLRGVPVERTRRRRLRDVLLFVLRVAAVLLLAASFARPYLRRAAAAPSPVTVVLVDVSASAGDAARVQRMRALAKHAVDAAPAGDAVALATFAARSDLLVAPITDRSAVKAAIDRIEPGYGPTSYRAGLGRAAEIVGDRGGRVAVVTDLQAGGWSGDGGALPDKVPVDVADLGPAPPDLGITAVTSSDGHLVVHVRNTGPARAATVGVQVNDHDAGSRVIRVGGNDVAEATLPVTLSPGDTARAHLSDPGGIPGDDERWLVAEAALRPRVDVITSPGASQQDALYVRRALEALDGPRAVDVKLRSADRVQDEGIPTAVAAVVLIGTAGLDRRGLDVVATYVRNGGGLLLPAGPGINPEIVQAGFGPDLPRVRLRPSGEGGRRLVLAETRHPALDVFARLPGAFADVHFTRTAVVVGTDKSDVLARFDTGEPALVAAPYGRGRVLVFASDLGYRWNDLALQPAFVPFVGEAVHWLADERAVPGALVAGTTPLPGADRPGVAEWPAGGQAHPPRVAVNVDPREFDPSRQTRDQFLAQVPRRAGPGEPPGDAEARRQEASQGLWRYGLALMLIGLVTESVIGRRS